MKHLATTLALLAAAAPLASHAQQAEEGDWLIRARAIHVNPRNDGGSTSIGGKPHAGTDLVPEVDITWFATPNIGLELIAATTEHAMKVNKGTSVDLGSVKLLPPTLTAQYHFTNPCLGKLKPYVGAGINYTHFYNADHPGLNAVKYDDAFGTVVQAGTDYKLTDKIYLNADIKQVFLSTDVTVNNSVTAKANLNPVIAGVGIGYRF